MDSYCLLIARDFEPQQVGSISQNYGIEFGLVLSPVADVQARHQCVGYFHHTSYPFPRTDEVDQQRRPPFFEDPSSIQEVDIIRSTRLI
jgi:hypothetical protein